MAIGDQDDMLALLEMLIPPWFGSDFPNLVAYLYGYAALAAFIYQLNTEATLQTRIATATGIFLDLINDDFLNGILPRKPGENDDTYRHRLQAYIIAKKNTRLAYIEILQKLTGRTPVVLEGYIPQDCNWLNGGFFLNTNSLGAGAPYTVYILAFRPKNSGNAFNGLNTPNCSLNLNTLAGANAGLTLGNPFNGVYVSDQDILDAIAFVHSAGIHTVTFIFD